MSFDLIKSHFTKLSEAYFKLDEQARATSFRNAFEKIEEATKGHLPASLDQLKGLKGVGPSTINEIKEVLETGTSNRLKELESRLSNTEISQENLKSKLSSLLKGNK